MDIECDVLVVGAGVAGALAALSSLHHGAENVLVTEKSQKVGGAVSQKIDFVENIGLKKIKEELDISFNISSNRSRWYSPTNKCFSLDSRVDDLWIKRGSTEDSFENRCIALAIKRGADLFLNSKVTNFGKKITVQGGRKTRKIRARVIIDASGVHSRFRKFLDPDRNFGTIDEVLGYGVVGNDFNMEAGVPEIFFDSELSPRSYVLACKDPNDGMGYLIQGIGKRNDLDSVKSFHKLIEKNNHLNEILDGAEIIKTIRGMLYINKSVPEKYIFKNVMFAGDSTHLMDPFLHYGVRPAIISGYLSGKKAAEYLSTGDLDSLKNYEKKMRDLFETEFKKRLTYRKIFDQLNNNDLEKIFDLLIDLKEKDIDFDSLFEKPYNYLRPIGEVFAKNFSSIPLMMKILINQKKN
ncbi:MAG: NAD(P)/FAD-dependent oxidoreductase [Candidatus Hodarchaeales archaeon]